MRMMTTMVLKLSGRLNPRLCWSHSLSQSWKQGGHYSSWLKIIWNYKIFPNKIFLFYRQLLSWYTLSHNANVFATDNNPALLPLWVRCDMSDPAGTAWLGAETICISNKVSGVKLYSITCKGITTDTYNYNRFIWIIHSWNVTVVISYFCGYIFVLNQPICWQAQLWTKDCFHPWMISNKNIKEGITHPL